MTISRFRHTQSSASRVDKHFLNVNPSGAIWDCSNMLACNDRFVAIPWSQFGSTVVMRHRDYGKVSPTPPLLLGQSGPIIDLAFNPFDSSKLFTASEDGTIAGWNIPEEGLTHNSTDHIVNLHGHSKKVGIISFHPSAANVLASAGADMIVNVWDVENGTPGAVLKCHNDQIMALDWNLDGSLLCSTSKDKKLNIIDPRTGDIVMSGNAHQGGKTQRCVWAKRSNIIFTTGFNKTQNRQVMIWDARDLTNPIQTEELDQASSIMMPFFDEDTNMFYIGSRGEGNIRSYELMGGQLINSAMYTSTEVHKGLCMFPKWSLDPRQCEVARFYALTPRSMFTIQMILPRRQADAELQTDVFPPTFANEPAITAKQYFEGTNSEPLVMDMHAVFDGKTLEPYITSNSSPEDKRSPTQNSPLVPNVNSHPAPKMQHADPMDIKVPTSSLKSSAANTNHKEIKKGPIEELIHELEKRQAEVNRCREELLMKERLVNETIAKISAAAVEMTS